MIFSLLGCAHEEPGILSTGPHVTACVVDSKLSGYQCKGSIKYFLPFSQVIDALQCISPHDLERMLKNCKTGIDQLPTRCQINKTAAATCVSPKNEISLLMAKDVDNYFCLSSFDWERVQDRCKFEI